jgi:ribosomal protein S2
MVIINSAKRSFVACSEARALSLPTFATLDSDYVALNAFYPLPSNDDSTGSFYFYNHIAMKTALLMKVYSLLKRKKEKILFEYKF